MEKHEKEKVNRLKLPRVRKNGSDLTFEFICKGNCLPILMLSKVYQI
jgi:hypothetical protein